MKLRQALISCLSLVAVLVTGACTQTTEPTGAFLWRIEGDTPSHLFGTIHVPDDRVAALPDMVKEAFAAADVVTTELELSPEVQLRMSSAMVLPEGQKLSDILPAELLARLNSWLGRRKLTLAPLDHVKVWALEAQLPLIDRMGKGGEALDTTLYKNAQKAGKETGAIETLEEQLSVFQAFTQAEQIESLDDSLAQLETADQEGRDLLEEILRLYLDGNETLLIEHLMADMDLENPREARFYKLLITDRDQRMAERVDRLLREQPGRSFFFAFGALHMRGLRGHLEEMGYRISRVESAPPK